MRTQNHIKNTQFSFLTLNYLMIIMNTIFNKLRITTEIKKKYQQGLKKFINNFFWIRRTSQIIIERRRLNENKIIKILFFHLLFIIFFLSLFFSWDLIISLPIF